MATSIIQIAAIFLTVLFLYLQMQYHYKKVNDLDIYHITDLLPKKQFDKLCDSDRIPFVFYFFETAAIVDFINTCDFSTACAKTMVNMRQFSAGAPTAFKPLSFRTGMINATTQYNWTSERNYNLLKAIQILPYLKKRDTYLRPGLCQFIDYDMLFGSAWAVTPLRYEINQRTFFMVTSGTVNVKLMPPECGEQLDPRDEPQTDNVLMEYWSAAGVWSPSRRLMNLSIVDLTLQEGQTLYVPPFWWYSVQFTGTNTRMLRFSYRNVINTLMLAPYFISHKYAMMTNGVADNLSEGVKTPVRRQSVKATGKHITLPSNIDTSVITKSDQKPLKSPLPPPSRPFVEQSPRPGQEGPDRDLEQEPEQEQETIIDEEPIPYREESPPPPPIQFSINEIDG